MLTWAADAVTFLGEAVDFLTSNAILLASFSVPVVIGAVKGIQSLSRRRG